MTFQQLWTDAAVRHADRTFLLFRDEDGAVTRWTYAAFDDAVARTAGTLRAAGLGRGDAVHVALRNCPGFVAIWLAAARLGATLVPVDPASTARDIASQTRRTRPAVGVCATARADVYREGIGPSGVPVLQLAEDASDLDTMPAGEPVDPVVVSPADRLAVMFTSGTTSEPKGVVLTQATYETVAREMAAAADLRARHRWFVTLPLFHGNAQYYCFAPAIAVGASVALSATFSASGWVPWARELEATHASLFAAPIRMILARTADDEPPLALEHVWFAQSLGAEHYARFTRLVGTRPCQLYGMTETVAIVCRDTSDPLTHDVIGTPLPGREIRVEETAGPGSPGELVVRGTPGVDLCAGYLDERNTAAAFHTDGDGTWFSTGDLVSRRPDGSLRFVGRVDDVIKVSGENVSLTEVEAVAAQAPGVLEVAVVAEPDPVRDVVPVAYVVARDPDHPPVAADLHDWAATALAPAARPRDWRLIDELPRTSVGKVRRFRITAGAERP